MLTKCKHCGEVAVDDTENEEVCHACGIVSQEMKLSTTDYTPFSSHTFTPFTRFESKFRQIKRHSKCLLHGLSVLDQLCHRNNINANHKADITDLFKDVCGKRNFNHREDAGVLAACCVFLVQRSNKQAIPIKIICNQVGCTRGKFSFYLSYLKSYLSKFQNDQKSVKTLDTSVCVKREENFEDILSDTLTSLIREVCEKAKKEEKSTLMKKATALVKLSEDCWLLTGRSPRSVVVACTYLCWKSMSPLRKKASYPKFCKTFEIHEPVAKQRLPELKALLLKLGQKIPSHTPNLVTEDNLLFHLNIILENSESLRNDLLPDIHESEAVNCREYSSFRFPVQNEPRKEPSSPVIYDPNMNASDIEISDTEIETYICSDSKRKIIELCEKKEKLSDKSDSE